MDKGQVKYPKWQIPLSEGQFAVVAYNCEKNIKLIASQGVFGCLILK
jgi:hypothetical protein